MEYIDVEYWYAFEVEDCLVMVAVHERGRRVLREKNVKMNDAWKYMSYNMEMHVLNEGIEIASLLLYAHKHHNYR